MGRLNERSSDSMYYFRGMGSFIDMLRNNKIVASLAFSNELETKKRLDKKYPFYISTSSSKSFELGYQKANNLQVRLKLRGDLINSDFKVSRVAYYDKDKRNPDLNNGKQLHNNLDELEERIYLTKSSIPFSRYVEEVTINTELTEYSEYLPLEKIEEYLTKLGIRFNLIGDGIEDNFDDIETNYTDLDDPDDDIVVFFDILCNKLNIDFAGIMSNVFGEDRGKEIYQMANDNSMLKHDLERINYEDSIDKQFSKFRMELNNTFHYDKSSSGNLELLSILGKILKKHNLTNPRNIFGLLYGKK